LISIYRKIFTQHNVEREMKLNPFSLSFSEEQKSLEAAFRKDYFNTNLFIFRICHIVSIFFYGAVSFLDYILFSDQFFFLAFIRFVVVIPIFLLGLLLTFHKSYEKLWPWTNNFYVILTGGGFILMIAYCPPPLSYSYYAGIIVCLFFGYTFIRSRFLMASTAGCTLMLIFIIVSIIIPTPSKILIRNLFFMFVGNMLGMIICYSTEIFVRKNFFLKNLLEEERNRVQETNEMLEKLVLERTEKLKESNQRLREEIREKKEVEFQLQHAQKMEAIGTLAGGIAHDFNNILGAIMGYAELAQLNFSGNPKVQRYIDQLFLASERAKSLVQQILSFSRQDKFEKIPIDISQLVKETLKLLRASIPTTIEINQNIESNLGLIEADPTQIQQVVMNLCTNALHAMEEEGGEIFVGLSPAVISLEDSSSYQNGKPGQYVKLIVKDTGHGMNKDTISHIFEPYFTTKDVGKGTGMGLAMVYGIVQSLGGDIRVHSKPGAGTSFHLLFPIIEKKIENTKQKYESPLPTGNEQILFVDDEKYLVDIGKDTLEGLGYQVETRTNAYDALEAFRAQPAKYDLIITDMTMPTMTGEQLASAVMKIRLDIPIILCTGYSKKAVPENAMKMGISTVLMKPVAINDMAKAVRKVLDNTKKITVR